LDSAFAQEKSQCGGNSIWVLTELFGQIALADDDIPSWVALMDIASVGRNPIGEGAKFFLSVTRRTLNFGLFGIETNSARGGYPDRTSNRRYDAEAIRQGLRARHIVPMLTKRNTEHGSGLGRWRWVVERTFARLNQFRRLRVRYEKRADIHEALLVLACALLCWNALERHGT
jgi:hypothetical protein